MPVPANGPNGTRPLASPGEVPETSDAVHGESVGAADETQAGTIAQVSPPAWVLSGGSLASDARSGRELSELEREIERSHAGGATDIAEGYTLVRKLGTGSFGAVWEAENRLTRERVAIKFFTAGHTDWAKLLTEVGLLQTVEGCGGIVMVKEVRQGGADSRPHYVMQLANGGSLAEWLKSAGSLSARERVRVAVGFFTRVARAMAAVHRRGIHHCDLKPHNILLHAPEPGAPHEPLVADFGQAQLATDDTPALGTFFYMPPDQIEAAQAKTPPDTRWDVYALGAVAYEMLTGEAPRRTPELVEKIKKAPKVLATKMAVYREGIVAAPKPEAHGKIADPMLAKIIDRCLNLRPEKRPADAGALLALLEARAKWRRTRPVLVLAACATLLIIAMIAALGLWTANTVTERTKANVGAEVTSSLARTAGYGTRAIEDRLQRYVVSLDQYAEKAHADRETAAALAALKAASQVPRGATLDAPALPPEGQKLVVAWLTRLHEQRKIRSSPGEHLPSLGLMVVTDDAQTGSPQSRGFYLARILSDGTAEDASRYANPADREFFRVDLSYRDYFHDGPGESPEVGKPHTVVRAAHISHPFRSRGIDRAAGKDVDERWKLNIVSPLWDDPAKRTRVIGLLVFGVDVEYDVRPLLYPTAFKRAEGSPQGYGIDEKVKVVVADNRGRWVWHPDCEKLLEAGRPDARNPRSYPELVRAHGLLDERAGPWLTLDAPANGADRHDYSQSDRYVDPMEAELHGDGGAEIACFTRFDPYARSHYRGQDASGKPAPPRRWVFVAQVDRKSALRPLDEMKGEIVKGGVAVVGALALVAAGLWAGLVLVLRRLEFGTNG